MRKPFLNYDCATEFPYIHVYEENLIFFIIRVEPPLLKQGQVDGKTGL
jgi:hypothetical protein